MLKLEVSGDIVGRRREHERIMKVLLATQTGRALETSIASRSVSNTRDELAAMGCNTAGGVSQLRDRLFRAYCRILLADNSRVPWYAQDSAELQTEKNDAEDIESVSEEIYDYDCSSDDASSESSYCRCPPRLSSEALTATLHPESSSELQTATVDERVSPFAPARHSRAKANNGPMVLDFSGVEGKYERSRVCEEGDEGSVCTSSAEDSGYASSLKGAESPVSFSSAAAAFSQAFAHPARSGFVTSSPPRTTNGAKKLADRSPVRVYPDVKVEYLREGNVERDDVSGVRLPGPESDEDSRGQEPVEEKKERKETSVRKDEEHVCFELERERLMPCCGRSDVSEWNREKASSLHFSGPCESALTRKLALVKLLQRWGLSFAADECNEDSEEFLERLLECCDATEVTDSELLSALPCILKGRAAQWYRAEREMMASAEDFKLRFRRQFLTDVDREDLLGDLRRRIQAPGEKVASFLTSFRIIRRRFERPPSEKRLVRQAYRNLLPEFRRFIADREVNTLEDIAHYGRCWERERRLDEKYVPPPRAEKMHVPAAVYPWPSEKVERREIKTSEVKRVEQGAVKRSGGERGEIKTTGVKIERKEVKTSGVTEDEAREKNLIETGWIDGGKQEVKHEYGRHDTVEHNAPVLPRAPAFSAKKRTRRRRSRRFDAEQSRSRQSPPMHAGAGHIITPEEWEERRRAQVNAERCEVAASTSEVLSEEQQSEAVEKEKKSRSEKAVEVEEEFRSEGVAAVVGARLPANWRLTNRQAAGCAQRAEQPENRQPPPRTQFSRSVEVAARVGTWQPASWRAAGKVQWAEQREIPQPPPQAHSKENREEKQIRSVSGGRSVEGWNALKRSGSREAKSPGAAFVTGPASRLNQPPPGPSNDAARPIFQGLCYECQIIGHRAFECPEVICHLCQEKGHILRQCPERNWVAPAAVQGKSQGCSAHDVTLRRDDEVEQDVEGCKDRAHGGLPVVEPFAKELAKEEAPMIRQGAPAQAEDKPLKAAPVPAQEALWSYKKKSSGVAKQRVTASARLRRITPTRVNSGSSHSRKRAKA